MPTIDPEPASIPDAVQPEIQAEAQLVEPTQPIIQKTPEPAEFNHQRQLITPQTGHRHTGLPGAFPSDDHSAESPASEGVESGETEHLSPPQTHEIHRIDTPTSYESPYVEDSDEDEEVRRQLNDELRGSPAEEVENSDADSADTDLADSPTNQERLQPLSADLHPAHIITTGRTRRPPNNPDFHSYYTSDLDNLPAVRAAFATGLYAPKPQNRAHRDDLPQAPRNWKEALRHPYKDDWIQAAQDELNSLEKMQAFERVRTPNDVGIQILPLIWVFAYKFDADGMLTKFKARICVRGDIQTLSAEEKRAATLESKTARAVFVLCAIFDLDIHQCDAITAFLNSRLHTEIYTQLPDGSQNQGMCWKLVKALYGLRISPRLWQEEASKVLQNLGLKSTSEDPCLFYITGIIVFFYVDDIIIASHPTVREQAKSLIKALHNAWKLRDLGEPSWFLNIRIIRDRSAGKLWLCQDAYINAMATKFHLTERARVTTPITMEDLKPYEGRASAKEIHLYQQKVGSVNYPTTMTRPDAAHAVAKLAQFLVNPGPKHHAAIDRVIIYLYHSRYLALQYGGHDITHAVNIFSDASFADNSDRKSSQGFLYQLYGGP
ncbi:MAG TPA: reverse transcriptase domain-containing protein, partial [Ktedonobacteraceae bacterium]